MASPAPPPLPAFVITSLGEAPRVLLVPRGVPVACIVSMGDPGERVPAGYARVPRRLRIECADVVTEGPDAMAPSARHVRQLLLFAETIAAAPGPTLFHCQAGISRSTAAAYTVACSILGAGHEDDALAHILALRPIAFPNRRIVELADAELARGGRMLAALRAHFG